MMKFKHSPVIFDEESHSYYLGEKRLLGITGLIHSILGLGVYPDAGEYTKDFVMNKRVLKVRKRKGAALMVAPYYIIIVITDTGV